MDSSVVFNKTLKAIQREKPLPQIIKLLNELGDVNYQSESNPGSLVIEAAKDGRIGLLRYLVENGADLNQHLENQGSSPLHQAAHYGHLECVEYLLAQGVDVSYSNMIGQTPLTFMSDNHNFTKDRLAIMIKLLDAGANINHQETHSGETALMKILQKVSYDFDIVEMLLMRGADPTIKSLNIGDAFDIAKLFNRDDALKLMEEYQKAKNENNELNNLIKEDSHSSDFNLLDF